MVIASNEWMNYDDVKKQSQIIETNAVMMAAPSSLPLSVVSTVSAVGAPNVNLGTLTTVGNNGTTTNLNDSSECEIPGCDSMARIVLVCQPDSHPFQTRTIYLAPNTECKVGRSIAKSKSSDNNAIFDCKVLSRTHAVIWFSNDGKFYVKDTKSSNGTYINDRRINSSEPVELNFGDVVKFGVEVMENSRKEVHGCIIASVKPYLPDGREAISITQDSPFRGDSRISFEELHRLNLYMQETSQREKLLKAKLQNIQNILDATRKNSTICWQSMIDEDRLLNRIDLLENKLQFLQKKSPADQLKEEILKLQEEKFIYQNSAKEALSKVYQERMDALQKLSKVERDYTCCESECSLLRDQIRYTKQNLLDVNTRLLSLESEYREYKEQVEKCQRETNEEQNSFDAAVADLANKLKERETECDEYKVKIGELLLICSKQLDAEDEKKKEKYTEESVVDAVSATNDVATVKTNDSSSTTTTLADGIDLDENNDSECEHPNHDDKSTSANKSTIMKWLENSDLNSKEGSLDIMKAICNESDSSDESENNIQLEKCSTATTSPTITTLKVANKLHHVERNLLQLEAELRNSNSNLNGVENGIQELENATYQVLNNTVTLLREAYNEISKQEIHTALPSINSTEPFLQIQDIKVEQLETEIELETETVTETEKDTNQQQKQQTQEIADYQNEVLRLQKLLENKESSDSDTVNSLQSECQVLKDKIFDLEKFIEGLHEENKALEKVIAENKANSTKLQNEVEQKEDTQNSSHSNNSSELFEKLIEEDTVAMNSAAVLKEEELILYKERFGKTQAENLKLKREIAELKLKFDDLAKAIFRKSLTYVTVFVAVIVYFIFSYI